MTLRFKALVGLAFALGFAAAASAAPPPRGLATFEMEGKVGSSVIGLNLAVRDYVQPGAGHYFYASRPGDLPVSAKVDGDRVTLQAPGGVFRLRLVGNGASTGQALNFYNAVGLQGTLTQGKSVLPVSLRFATVYPGPPPTSWYAGVTTEPDTAFEARVRTFVDAVIAGDRSAAADAVAYPLQVNGFPSETIQTKAELLARWDRVFTPRLIAKLKDAIPHEMFVRKDQAMVCDGLVWFAAKGAVVINRPD